MEPYLQFSNDKLIEFKNNYLIINIIKKIVSEEYLSKASILDFGCGHGNITLGLSYHCKKVTGFDISGNMLDFSKNLCRRLLKLDNNFKEKKVKFVSKLFHNNIKFNIIIAINSIHFLTKVNLEKTLEQFKDILEENGYIIIIEPTKKSRFSFSNTDKEKERLQFKLKQLEKTKRNLHELLKNSKIIKFKDKEIYIIR